MAGPFAVLWASLTVKGRGRTLIGMKTVSIAEAQDRFDELAQQVEKGETVTVTRDGRPVFDIVPREGVAQKKGGIDWEAGQAYLRSIGIKDPFPYIADDFDDPLPEDFLLRPLP
jgi:prevent-host-death family protein